MQIQIESTDQITVIGGVQCRVWKGTTASGIPCILFVHRIAVDRAEDSAEFDRELREMDPDSGLPRVIPLSHIL